MDWLSKITLGLAIATVLLAATAVWSIMQTKAIHKKELKIRLLDKIAQWGIELQTASLRVKSSQIDILKSYAIVMSKNEYIKAIVNESFKADLSEDVKNLIKVCTELIILIKETLGITDVTYPPTGDILDIQTRIQDKILRKMDETGKTRIVIAQELYNECEIRLATCIEELLTKVGKITANLLTS